MPTIFADANKRPRTPSDANILYYIDFWMLSHRDLVRWPESNLRHTTLKIKDKK